MAIATPKAAALDLIGASEGSLGVRETTKTLDIAQNKFISWCVNNGWMYRDSKDKLQPYSGRIQQGYMEHARSHSMAVTGIPGRQHSRCLPQKGWQDWHRYLQ